MCMNVREDAARMMQIKSRGGVEYGRHVHLNVDLQIKLLRWTFRSLKIWQLANQRQLRNGVHASTCAPCANDCAKRYPPGAGRSRDQNGEMMPIRSEAGHSRSNLTTLQKNSQLEKSFVDLRLSGDRSNRCIFVAKLSFAHFSTIVMLHRGLA